MLTTFLLGENNSRIQTASKKPFYQLDCLKLAKCKKKSQSPFSHQAFRTVLCISCPLPPPATSAVKDRLHTEEARG